MRNALLAFIAAVALAGCASGGSRDMTPEIDSLMRAYDGDVPGASVLVIRDGTTIVRRSYGLADLEHHVAVTPATNFRLASVTKQFTAAAILLLVHDGKLRLDDSLRHWLPSMPPVADSITIRHLLTHSSGLLDYEDLMDPQDTAQIHDDGVLQLLATRNETYFPPGTSYRYSNSGYSLLSLIVARASGVSFATFLDRRIFQPLGMTHTVAFEDGISTVANRAFGYTLRDGRWTRTDQSTTSAVLGDGGVYSSIDDLARWDAALYDERLLPHALLADAFAPHVQTDDPAVQYGYGWRISGDTIWHSGETVGFRNVIARNPKRKLTVVVLTNRNEPEPHALATRIAAMF